MSKVYKPNGSFTTSTSFVGFIRLKSDEDRGNLLSTYVQEFETPNFTKNYTTKRKANSEAFLKGVAKTKTPVTLNFIIDEDWVVYTQLLDIFNDKLEVDDVQLFLLNGDDIAVAAITYEDASITNIAPIQVNTKEQGVVYVTVPVEFIFKNFNYERLK